MPCLRGTAPERVPQHRAGRLVHSSPLLLSSVGKRHEEEHVGLDASRDFSDQLVPVA